MQLKRTKRVIFSVYYSILFFLFSLKELIISNINILRFGLKKELLLKDEKYILYKTDLKSKSKINLLCYIITLTPGTIVVDCNFEKSQILIHCLFCKNTSTSLREIKDGFEKILSRI